AVGLAVTVASEVVELGFQPGDRFLLCSDGLTDLLTDSEIVAILNEADSLTAPDLLISAANEAGGTDNISVLLIAPDD
ncbi:MAG: serine/threonine-protein phosphatase, partial [Pseudomonadales bacterium]